MGEQPIQCECYRIDATNGDNNYLSQFLKQYELWN